VLVAGPQQAWLLEPNQPGSLSVPEASITPLWFPDSSRFLVPQGSAIIERLVGGSAAGRELVRAPGLVRLEDISPDGKVVLFTSGAFATSVFAVRVNGTAAERAPTTVLQGELVWNTRFSHDGRWIVYQVPGQNGGIYVQPFERPGPRKQIASAGEYPVWRRDGKEILYLGGGQIWSVRVETSSEEVRTADPVPLFSVRPSPRVLDVSQLAVSSDGSRIYFPQAVEQPDSDMIHIRVGWER
jgi:hypothetical protein